MKTKIAVLVEAKLVLKQFADETDGVWRTIRGRRVFIKKGESPTDAVKRSLVEEEQRNRAKEQRDLEALAEATRRGYDKLGDDEVRAKMLEAGKGFVSSVGYDDLHDKQVTAPAAGASVADSFGLRFDAGNIPGEVDGIGLSVFNPNRGAPHFRVRSSEDFDKLASAFDVALAKAKAQWVAVKERQDQQYERSRNTYDAASAELKRRGLSREKE